MLYYDFRNFEGFKERFGFRECGNGEKTRRNKILLSYIKQPELLKEAVRTNCFDEINISSMTQLWNVLSRKCDNYVYAKENLRKNDFHLMEIYLCSSKYRLDEFRGICEDGDVKSVRYVNIERGRVYKMKASTFFNACITEMGIVWPDNVRLWMCEEFQRQWEVYAATHTEFLATRYELHVDDNFRDIYDSDECDGDFHSCMTDDDNHYFYEDAVDAKAAYLRDKESGYIVARCIIFNEVQDDRTGEIVRLAERQYSVECNELLKRLLVDALLKGGHIDGYKKVGVDCHNNRAFIGKNGEDWSDRKFSIHCELEDGETLSYQDSFVYFNEDEQVAYNYYASGARECLNTTDGTYTGEEKNYDEYHDEYTREDVIRVYYDGRCITTENSDWGLEDFHEINGDYYHEDYCVRCPYCGDWMLQDDDNYYSELTGDSYCCENCMEEAEQEWRNENMYYSEYDEDWTDDEDEVTTFKAWYPILGGGGYHYSVSILTESLNKLIEKGEVILCNGVWYALPFDRVWQNNNSFSSIEKIYND